MQRRRIAVIGHVEHITLGRVDALPVAGDIAHPRQLQVFPGGGGGVAFFQLLQSPAEILLFTAVGNDDAGQFVRQALARTDARVFAAERAEAHTRDVVLVTPDGERTIVVVGEPLHPRRADALPWELLASCDAAYFTAQDPDVLREARSARILVATARRREAILRSGVAPDVIVGSAHDSRERSTRADYPHPPAALVMTEGARGGYVETASGIVRFPPPPTPAIRGSAYGAGDSFAGALTAYLAAGCSVVEACTRAGKHGAAVLGGWNPLENQVPIEG